MAKFRRSKRRYFSFSIIKVAGDNKMNSVKVVFESMDGNFWDSMVFEVFNEDKVAEMAFEFAREWGVDPDEVIFEVV